MKDIPGKLNDGTLQSKADAQHGNPVDPGPVGSCHLSLNASGPKTPRDQHPMARAQLLPSIVKLDSILVLFVLGVNTKKRCQCIDLSSFVTSNRYLFQIFRLNLDERQFSSACK